MPARVRAVLDGVPLEGWTSVTVSSSLDELAASFELSISTRRDGPRSESALVREGITAQILIDNRLVLTGYVDTVRRQTSSSSRTITAAGRSKAGDLVDCSVVGDRTARHWRSQTATQIAAALAEPYGIAVSSELADIEPIRSFRATAGEEIVGALDRLGQLVGGRWVSAADGGIRLVRSTGLRTATAAIRRGHNVFESEVELSCAERYSDYVFRAQLATNEDLNGDAAANVKFAVADEGVARYRPLVVQDDAQGGRAALERRAKWERTTRAGRSVVARYTVIDPVDGHRSWYAGGELWEPGLLVHVVDGLEGATGTWLVARRELVRQGEQISARLELVHPDAYTLETPKPRKRKELLW